MKITECIVKQLPVLTEVKVIASDDDGNYQWMDTYTVVGALPKEDTPARKTWDGEREKEIGKRFTAWKAIMVTPVPKPTKADHERELARAQRDKTEAEAKIAALTASIAEVRGG